MRVLDILTLESMTNIPTMLDSQPGGTEQHSHVHLRSVGSVVAEIDVKTMLFAILRVAIEVDRDQRRLDNRWVTLSVVCSPCFSASVETKDGRFHKPVAEVHSDTWLFYTSDAADEEDS